MIFVVLAGCMRTCSFLPNRTVPVTLSTSTADDAVIREPDLIVPHPRMHERAFVLVPLGELDDDPPLPGGIHLASLRLDPARVLGVRRSSDPLSVPTR